jgi:hypothetical protein
MKKTERWIFLVLALVFIFAMGVFIIGYIENPFRNYEKYPAVISKMEDCKIIDGVNYKSRYFVYSEELDLEVDCGFVSSPNSCYKVGDATEVYYFPKMDKYSCDFTSAYELKNK